MRWAATSSTFLVVATMGLLYGRMPYLWALAAAILLQSMPFAAFLFGFYSALPWHFSFPLAVLVIGLTTIQCQRRIDLLLALAVGLLCVTHLLVAFMVLLCLSVMQGLTHLRQSKTEVCALLIPWVVGCLGSRAVSGILAACGDISIAIFGRNTC